MSFLKNQKTTFLIFLKKGYKSAKLIINKFFLNINSFLNCK